MVGLGLRRPLLHHRPALLVRLRGRRAAGAGGASTTTWPARPTTSGTPSSVSPSTTPSSAAAGCSSRCCAPRGSTRRPTRPGSAARPATTSPSWAAGRPRAGCADGGPAGWRLDRPAGPRPGRDAIGPWLFSPAVRPPMAAYGRKSTDRRCELAMLYRGPLASCNYDCPYCPFAKRRDTAGAAARRPGRAGAVHRLGGARTTDERLSVLFTPWGEGLTRRWYRDAMVTLSHLPHVRPGGDPDQPGRPAWTGWPTPTGHGWRCGRRTTRGRSPGTGSSPAAPRLAALGVRYSVGVVGLPEHLTEARALRAALPDEVYLWVNAAEGTATTPTRRRRWTALDPLFGYSVRPHPSPGRPCHAGETAISVRGDGTVRRCHFVPRRSATSTTARGAPPCAPGLRARASATATSGTSTSSRSGCATSSPAGCWNGSRLPGRWGRPRVPLAEGPDAQRVRSARRNSPAASSPPARTATAPAVCPVTSAEREGVGHLRAFASRLRAAASAAGNDPAPATASGQPARRTGR